jgi:uncharacterized protein (TIGR02301 family)
VKTGIAAAFTAVLLWAPGLHAAGEPPLPPEKPPGIDGPAPPQAPADTLPPYQGEVERLATLMGTLAFMRDLCGAGDGAQWRAKMEDLLASEGSTAQRRDRLAGAFNEGLQGYAQTYRRCTPAAGVIIERSLDEASHLTRDLATRFGG